MKKENEKRKNPIIALAQIVYYDTGERHNIAKIKKYIKLAKKRKADIICFPESSISKTDSLSFNHKLIREIKEETGRLLEFILSGIYSPNQELQ